MLNTNNDYFEEMERVAHAFEADRAARLERKREIIAAHGYGSEELEAWYAEDSIKISPSVREPTKPTALGRPAFCARRMRLRWTISSGKTRFPTLWNR